jgi:hypothetical protein
MSQSFKIFFPKFLFGRLVAMPGALAALRDAGQTPFEFLCRHVSGDWGELCADGIAENERSLREGSRLLSAYRVASVIAP